MLIFTFHYLNLTYLSLQEKILITKIEIGVKPGLPQSQSATVKKHIYDLGIKSIKAIDHFKVFYFDGELSHDDIRRICESLLIEPITEHYTIDAPLKDEDESIWNVEIAYNSGVMDPVVASTMKGIHDLGFSGEIHVKTAQKYHITGALSTDDKKLIVDKVLMNGLIQHAIQPDEKIFADPTPYQYKRVEVDLLDANDDQLMEISRTGQLFLNVDEMKTIQAYFKKLGRKPTDIELETLAQTWSEHCSHKTFRGRINFNGEIIDNLLKTTVMRVTRELDKPWCISVFKDNAGVITFDDEHDVCFKVETHNHPSALEPYGGANTGIGGVIRDPLGTGLGAKPIVNTDVFCFGRPDFPRAELPPGTLHPRRVFIGVHAGVRDYGNRMGIPTVNGAIFFDDRYVGNPLVFCGNVGLLPKGMTEKKVKKGDKVVVVGGRTGRDGIHGATFSSGELTSESETVSSGAVQIGDPITEKKMTDVILQARDRGLYTAITDCGAGGLSSAIGEICESTGAIVDLEKVPLKYKGLSYTEIWISEAQERMVLIVPPENEQTVIDLFTSENVEATVVAEVSDTKRLQLRYHGDSVADIDMEFLHNGVPQLIRDAIWTPPALQESSFPEPTDLTSDLKQILSSLNVCSKEWVIRQYDHEVQGGSVLKPLVGIENDGPGDAAVVRPVLGSNKAIIISNGINPKYGYIDTYHMAASAIDEAIRQVIAVGGTLDKVALLDNFCWGNTDKPDRLGTLVRASQACYDIAKVYETPFISGKDSLNNEFQVNGESVAIPPTLLISAMAIMDDASKAISMDVKQSGNSIYIVGDTKNEMGGSHYFDIHNYTSNRVPQVDAPNAKKWMQTLSKATSDGLVASCHDCSEGGLSVAVAEMAFAGGKGISLELQSVPNSEKLNRNDQLLFSESNSRFIVEVAPVNVTKFETLMQDIPCACIGKVRADDKFEVIGLNGKKIIHASIAELKEAWQAPLRW
ncbi:phosphoribosylformylglycinamidine synthase subunit PurL [candidate division KSB1 bacterium]|nr:phosphoribosylformylglycinamidine synthase subunit PurL [candidate division KSB1 bacterium]